MSRFVPRRALQETAFACVAESLCRETPLYEELRQTNEEVNVRTATERPELGYTPEQARSLSHVMHCATRLGTPDEAAKMTRIYAAMDMVPVNFYDLTQAGENAQPFISTAYRSLRGARHRMFSSLLCPEYFAPPLRAEIEDALKDRHIIPDELTALADESAAEDGLPEARARRFIELFTALTSFQGRARNHALYLKLRDMKLINVADIVCFHKDLKANHATPCSLDIDRLFKEMRRRLADEFSDLDHRGMKESIEGPPPPASPGDALPFLRQTSYNALRETVIFENADGTETTDVHVVRFGEIEQRGVALTPAGKALYDEAVARAGAVKREINGELYVGKALARKDYMAYVEEYRACFSRLPVRHEALRAQGLAYYRPFPASKDVAPALREEAARALAVLESLPNLSYEDCAALCRPFGETVGYAPVMYDDFLPVSAAGIFGSNDPLKKTGAEFNALKASPSPVYRREDLEARIGAPIRDYAELCAAEVKEAARETLRVLSGYSENCLTKEESRAPFALA